ncbi:glutamate receptor ionotropic, kainate glr-3-like [Oppia nitens]|uniref:glutamate receptor ionotropic, kainate glr-3-like n=1 Tax=Oppia nitens TaxID=1686743 RepID=UPI0023DB981D|nr:glutamate receptor ionotropic, kainate glr-3-like [Oppia nitens]
MKNFSDFDYYLNDANELAAQQSKSGSISFLLDQLWRNNAEFGVSYITVTDERRQLIDFTDPLLNYSISALIHKSNVGNMRSFNELADQTRITYGALRNGDTMKMFDGSGDMVVRRMLALMNSTGVPVDSLPEAVFRVRSERYAFIADSITIQQLARDNCDMTVIVNNWPQFRRSVAIALPKGSPYLRTFNSLIKRLIETNILYVIRERYWKIICNYNIGNTVTTTKLISLGMTFTSILLTTYLLN